ncbi:Ribosome-interacting GTPase 1 like protein [Verticillium longisporum]|nr:Ribosome-interacting GTPase 1 like protein [Verticillium longisporum]
MSTTVDKIKEIEAEMAKTQKNKATSFHLGQLKAKLAKLKRELLTPSSGGGGGGAGFDVARTGVASPAHRTAFRGCGVRVHDINLGAWPSRLQWCSSTDH